MPNENTITISIERFQQLIRAEEEANQLKAIIDDAFAHYHPIERSDIELLHVLYFGDVEG